MIKAPCPFCSTVGRRSPQCLHEPNRQNEVWETRHRLHTLARIVCRYREDWTQLGPNELREHNQNLLEYREAQIKLRFLKTG